jgi:AcrR family transcriptional regulator
MARLRRQRRTVGGRSAALDEPAQRWPATPVRATSLCLSEVVAATGVPASTIHHYRRAGVIPPPERPSANRFVYDDRHVRAIRLVRSLRERRGLHLEEIAEVLPGLLAATGSEPADRSVVEPEEEIDEPFDNSAEVRERVIDAAFIQFRSHTYDEVTVGAVADAAKVAKGSFYRHFASKEELFTAVVEHLLAELATNFAEAVDTLGGAEGLAGDPQRFASVFALLVARSLPVLLEVGAWAAKGRPAAQVLSRDVLRTLAEAVGRPLAPDDPIPAGLAVIESAFGTVLHWAMQPDWPAHDRRKGGLGVTLAQLLEATGAA